MALNHLLEYHAKVLFSVSEFHYNFGGKGAFMRWVFLSLQALPKSYYVTIRHTRHLNVVHPITIMPKKMKDYCDLLLVFFSS
ncbi:unnamed protein product [Urochloa humidicola]